ncbi:MAG: DUF1028 domain-containing protein [Candidatus Eremiobacteraeota bacterium]|nr:DUF1028 domain-containing protein [Candidatus Eremiobacteraeota bacterium]
MRTSTFSIVAFDATANELGVAVQSKFLAVGSVVPWVIGGVGAIATQAWANTTYGSRGLDLLEAGHDPTTVIGMLTETDEHREERQVGIVDSLGRSATFTGKECVDWAGCTAGAGYAAQGNILAGPLVVKNMADAYENAKGCLADRLVGALRAAQAAGGDRRGKQSAALYIAKPDGGYGGFNDRYVDLRVDDHPEPIEELARLLELHKLYFFKAAPADVITIDGALGAELCALLRKTGRLKESSAFDETARRALVEFMHAENLENRVRDDGTVDRQTLEYLRTYASR